jgi:diguanylate cyclase (GGDEF)-like protein
VTTVGPAQTPVHDRLATLQLVRVTMAVFVAALPPLVATRGALLALPLAYLAVVGCAELARRRVPRLGPMLLSAMVIVDGAFLAAAVLLTGGTSSPVLFLAFLEVVAVTLLASPLTGLRLAVWCALLLFLGREAAAVGVISVKSTGDDRTAALSAVAFLLFAVGAAVFQAVNERALRHTGSELSALVRLGGSLERARTPDDVVQVLVDFLRRQLGFARVLVLVRGEDGWVTAGDTVATGAHTGPLGRIGSAAFDDGSPRLVRKLDGGLLAEHLPDARNVVVAPLLGDDEPLGLVAAEWSRGGRARISGLTVSSLKQSVSQAALTLRNARLLHEVEHLATRDELTGLANRRLFEETLALELGRHQRTGAALTVVALDVDHFKVVNDEYGHPAGDAVLRSVGDALRRETKAYDLPARYGGDEFLVLLPGCGAADAPAVAERLRGVAGAATAPTPVTVSAGTATAPDDARDGASLVAAADAALYEAKRSGRDRVGSVTAG